MWTADNEVIVALPPTWLTESEAEEHPLETKRYSELAARLLLLNDRRKEVLERVERLRRMDALLDPFRSDSLGQGVQENLITREGEIERELQKMRVLLARVGGRVALLPDSTDSGSLFREEDSVYVEDVAGIEKRKVDDLLDRM
jgi:hypothetical protein